MKRVSGHIRTRPNLCPSAIKTDIALTAAMIGAKFGSSLKSFAQSYRSMLNSIVNVLNSCMLLVCWTEQENGGRNNLTPFSELMFRSRGEIEVGAAFMAIGGLNVLLRGAAQSRS